jgi:hypothetical protein
LSSSFRSTSVSFTDEPRRGDAPIGAAFGEAAGKEIMPDGHAGLEHERAAISPDRSRRTCAGFGDSRTSPSTGDYVVLPCRAVDLSVDPDDFSVALERQVLRAIVAYARGGRRRAAAANASRTVIVPVNCNLPGHELRRQP